MAQLEEAAAGTEADVIETAPEVQGNTETSEVNEAEAQTTEQALYEDDQPTEGEEVNDEQQDDDDDGEDEAPEPVNAPASLKAEEKEKFAQLPPDAQRVLSEVLQRRDQEIQTGLETAREAQRQAEAQAADRVAQTQQQFASQFEALVQAFQPTPPPVELARTNPAEYQYRKAIFDEEAATYQQLVGQINTLKNEPEQHFAAQQQAWTQEQVKQLLSVPEIANEETRAQTLNAISAFGNDLGYSKEELANATAKDLIALNKMRVRLEKAEEKAARWDRHQAKRNERPRAAQGRFAAAPVGNGTPPRAAGVNDTLKALYPND